MHNGIHHRMRLCMVILLAMGVLCADAERSVRQASPELSFKNPSYSFCVQNPAGPGTFIDQLSLSYRPTSVHFFIPSNDPNFAINPSNGQLFVAQSLPSDRSFVFVVQAQDLDTDSTTTTFVNVHTSPCDSTTTTTTMSPFRETSYSFRVTNCTSGSYIGSVAPYARSVYQTTYDSQDIPNYVKLYSNGQLYLMGTFPVPGVTFVVAAMKGTERAASVYVTVSNECPRGTSTTTTTTTTTTTATTTTKATTTAECVATPASPTTLKFGQWEFLLTTRNCAAGTKIGNIWMEDPNVRVTYSIPSPTTNFRIDNTGTVYSTAPIRSGEIQPVQVLARDASGKSGVGCLRIQTASNCPAYAFTATSCERGARVGQVPVSSTLGPVTFTLSGNFYFTINPVGVIAVSSVPPTSGATELMNVLMTSGGKSWTHEVSVTIPRGCKGSTLSPPDFG